MFNSTAVLAREPVLGLYKPDIAVFNRLVPIDGKPTNVAIWCPFTELVDKPERLSPVRYYLSHKGDALKTRNIEATAGASVDKFGLIFPGFNGGPFDQFHLAEKLAQAGYWVMSVGCYINPNLKPSDDPGKIAFALEEAYPDYNSVLGTFSALTGLSVTPEQIAQVRYISFSAGIYPLIRAVRTGTCPAWEHRLMLMAPGLSATNGLDMTLTGAPIDEVDLIHSKQDAHPTYGSPLHYLNLFNDDITKLHLLAEGKHYDFIHLPLQTQLSSPQSQHEQQVKQQCLSVLESLLSGEIR